MPDVWDVAQYEKFKDERSQPFFDLLALVEPRPDMRSVDLGCGTGELTAILHRQLGCTEMLGIDNSLAMLEKSRAFATDTLRFEQRTIDDFANDCDDEHYDLIFSNAALQWVEDHAALLPQLAARLTPLGQLAIQVPANHDHPAQTTAQQLARREPYQAALGGFVRLAPVLPPEGYARILHSIGLARQHVRLQVYGHLLPDRDAVAEWTKGTVLTDYEKRLPPELYAQFWGDYKAELRSELEDARPYFFTFKRILLWASR